ncbi:PTS transporter subunit IIC [Anaerofustis stercorihominis]|uniref:PTS transporter subunit IIC n=1 Tax=Anaerofustis stercorihominis TaxID=214853 RepID=UPI002672198F|nr:PTS transporter subunit IIC [Anaerofustis stercorihominis]
MDLLIKVVTQFFGNGTIVLGLVALIGSILLKKKGSEILLSTIKCMLGFAIMDGGSTLLLNAMGPLKECIFQGLNTKGVLQQMWPAYVACSENFAGEIAIVFLLSMLVNGVLVRFTKNKGFALTVHLQLFVAAMFVAFLHVTTLPTLWIIIISTIGSGVYNWIAVGVSHYYMKKTDMTDEFGLFVFCNWGMALSELISKIIGKGKDAEDINFPESLMWLKDTFTAITITMFINYFIFGLIAGVDFVSKLAGDQFWWLFLFLQSLSFSAGLAVILYGVKMFIAEIIPAFVGIADAILPDAVVGLDYPTAFQFSPTAVMFGFIANLLGSLCATVLMAVVGMPVLVVPGIQGQFFEGAIVGVFGNRIGGLRVALVASFLYGFITLFLISFIAPSSGVLLEAGAFYESAEFAILPLIIQKIVMLFG